MRSRAVAALLAVLVVADLASSGPCCLLTPTAASPASGCCGAEPTTPFCSILGDSGTPGRPGCAMACYETPGSTVARRGTGSTAGRQGVIATGWVADVVSGKNPSPCLRYSLSPPALDGGHLATTPRGPPIN